MMDTNRSSQLIELHRLDLDSKNPRFGGRAASDAPQAAVLEHIVSTFGIADVLASLASNGYFDAEPLIGRQIDGTDRYVIVEGNRRLAACLILSRDPRAELFKDYARPLQQAWETNGKPRIDPVPVICFEATGNEKELLSYLGVRHISSSTPWDSYAKAAWVSDVVSKSGLTVAEVAQMIGDKNKTIVRMLEGYHFVIQAEKEGVFRPQDSAKSGRGSVTAYPFSWVYTLLGYQATRQFLELKDGPPEPSPVAPENLARAGLVLRAMFGDKSKGTSAALSDSRQLGDLASLLVSQDKVALLEQGKSVAEIVQATLPMDDRLRTGFAQARLILEGLISGISSEDVPSELSTRHLSQSGIVRRLAIQAEKLLNEAAGRIND